MQIRLVLLTLCVSSAVFLGAQNWVESQQFLPPNDNTSPIGGQSDEVGRAVDISGDYAVVGAPHSDINSSSSGLAIVYEKSGGTWSSVAQLTPADGAEGDLFGWNVAIDGDRMVIGAPGDSPLAGGSGSAYVYERVAGVWTEDTKLVPSTGGSDHQFGFSVDLDGDKILIGAQGDNTFGSSSGGAFVFELVGGVWTEQAKLVPSDGAANDRFGFAVSIDDTLAVCGAFLHDAAGNGAGAVYVYNQGGGTWPLFEKILAPDATNADRFGVSVGISDTLLVAGATRDDDGANNSGSVYVFDLGPAGFVLDDKLVPGDAGANDEFGFSVMIEGDYVIGGAQLEDNAGANSGAAYVFHRSAGLWAEEQKIIASDGAAEDRFAFDVAISGNQVIVGSRYDDDTGINSGSSYIYLQSGTTWAQEFKGIDNDMIDDPSQDIFGSAVAISWDNAVVGSSGDDDFGPLSGSVRFYAFDGTSWNEQGKYYGDNARQSLNFGHALTISGDRAAIGAYGDNTQGSFAGGVYIFEKSGTTWSQVQKLNAGDGAAFDNFGFSVSMDVDVLVVGAYLDDDDGNNSGSIYVYEHNGSQWVLDAKLKASDGAANRFFGRAVSVSGDLIVVGARQDGTQATNSGSAYIFEKIGGTWMETAKIYPSNPSNNKLFGNAVSASGDIVMVGGSGDPVGGDNSGAVYVYEDQGGWAQTQRLKANIPNESEFFGFSLDHTMDKAVIGAYRALDAADVISGTTYVFENDGTQWSQVDSLFHSDPVDTDYFGVAVAIEGSTALIGAQFDDDNGENAGSAFIFNDCLDADSNGVCDFAEIASLNNICDSAIELTPALFGTPAWQTFSLLGASESLAGCSGDANDDVWFKFTAIHQNDLIIADDTTGTIDLVVEVFDGCGGASLGCFDNSGIGENERAIPGGLIPGNEYLFRVYDKASGEPATGAFRLQIKTFANMGLRDKYCGVMNYALDDVVTPHRQDLNEIYPFTTILVNGYDLLFIDQDTQDSVIMRQTGFASHFFHLEDYTGLELNHSYTVKARHRLRLRANGLIDFWWSDFSTECTIAFAGPVETSIIPSFCDTPGPYAVDDYVQAYHVDFADLYRFTLVGGGQTLEHYSPSYTMFLDDVNGLEPGVTYAVTVRSRVNGLWSQPGDVCSIEIDGNIPSTALQDVYCDGDYQFPSAQYLLADFIPSAEKYEWSFSPVGGGAPLIKQTNGLSIAFHTAGLPFEGGLTYSVTVRVRVNGIWGTFGDACDITLVPSSEAPPTDDLATKSQAAVTGFDIWPNPSDIGTVWIKFDNLSPHTEQTIELFDSRGSLVKQYRLNLDKGQNTVEIDIADQPKGLYLLRWVEAGRVSTRSLTIQ